MIDLYTWTTPNGHKLHIMLEECALEYRAHPINIGNGEQFKPEFLKISPNNKIPAMVDQDGPDGQPMSLFESGAMLIYLADKTGQFLPADARKRYETLTWLMFQMGHVGPMLGQAHHFNAYAPNKEEYAIQRYQNEAKRLYGVMDKRLGESDYLAGAEYTIADIATMPWLRSPEKQGVAMGNYPNVKRWFDAINERPAVRRGLDVLSDVPKTDLATDKKAWENMFGGTQYEKR
jgi:GST-like protein